MSGHVMDQNWFNVATSMGHTPTISPQTTLDNTAFFAGSDALIIASGTIALTATRVNTIQQFAQTGKPVFIQGEYLNTYTTNIAYASIVNALGGSITWVNTTAGTLAPMNVLGSYATNPTATGTLSYFWYGCYGNASGNVTPFLQYGGLNYGFAFCPPTPGIGQILTTTDQDWVLQNTNNNLMRNIIAHMLTSISCTVLPAEDLKLSASTADAGEVLLQWDPEVVEGGDLPSLFELERSKDGGQNFERIYATMKREGSSFHDQPGFYGQALHYRLRVVDGNGSSFVSNIATATLVPPASLLECRITPTPARQGERMQVHITSGLAQSGVLEVIDLAGAQAIYTQQLDLESGQQSVGVNLGELPRGMYHLRVKTAGASVTTPLVIH